MDSDRGTFTPPPSDGLTLPQIYDFQGDNSPNHPVFKYTTEEGEVKVLNWASVSSAVRQGSSIVHRDTQDKSSTEANRPVHVAILANTDSISYLLLVMSVMRTGRIPFPISPRCSAAAVHHLLNTTSVSHVYVSHDDAMQDLITKAKSEFRLEDFTILPMPIFEEFWFTGSKPNATFEQAPSVDVDSPALILHSSGTTSFPKPIFISHRILIQRGYLASNSGLDFSKHVLSLHSVPMFHAFGINCISRIPVTGVVVAFFPPRRLPKPVNPKTSIAAALTDKCTLLACVPSILEELVHHEPSLKILRQFYAVLVSGGPLSTEAGGLLVQAGVRLSIYYAGTEIGVGTIFLSDKREPKDWEYVEFMPQFGAHLIPREEIDTYELVAIDTPLHRLAVINSSIDGKDAYKTGDIFKRHPTNPSLWKVWGRADDQIILSNGEKTNPGPIENIFIQHPKINRALMFGQGQVFNGILLELKEEYWFPISDLKALDEFRKSIGEALATANAMAPTHSRLFEEMILVSHPDKPFAVTAKGNVRRVATLANYSMEIDEAYKLFSASPFGNYDAKFIFSGPSALPMTIKSIVEDVMGRIIVPEKDLFQQGCDSLQALRICSTLEYMLSQQLPTKSTTIPRDILYEFPTLISLTNYLTRLQDVPESNIKDKTIQDMMDMLRNLTSDFSKRIPLSEEIKAAPKNKNAIIVTGTTGCLGCHLLCMLACMNDVSRIYAVNRFQGNGTTLFQRQMDAIKTNGLDESCLLNGRVVLIEADLTNESWGVSKTILDEMKATVSVIIHTAWKVNFILKLQSFTDCLIGLQSLIDFATENREPCHLVFISSLAVSRNWPKGKAFTETSVDDPSYATGQGYSESKWVAEQVLKAATTTSNLKATIIRAGQLSGAENGFWKVTEWFPCLVRSSRLVGCLPATEQLVSWLPVAYAAEAIINVSQTEEPLRHFHLVHPHRVPFVDLIQPIAALLSVPVVPYNDWLQKLRILPANDKSSSQMTTHDMRVFALLPYFSARGQAGDSEKWQDSEVDITETLQHSAFMSSSDVVPLGQTDAQKWTSYWMSVGLL